MPPFASTSSPSFGSAEHFPFPAANLMPSFAKLPTWINEEMEWRRKKNVWNEKSAFAAYRSPHNTVDVLKMLWWYSVRGTLSMMMMMMAQITICDGICVLHNSLSIITNWIFCIKCRPFKAAASVKHLCWYHRTITISHRNIAIPFNKQIQYNRVRVVSVAQTYLKDGWYEE